TWLLPPGVTGRPATPSIQSPRAAGGGPRRAVPARLSARATMKAILSAALALGLCGLAAAQDTKADPVGTWKCEYDIGGQKRESTLAIKKDGDKLTGTMTYQDKQEAKLKDLKFKDGELTFSAERELTDNKFT